MYTVFRRWRQAGVWERVHAASREQCLLAAGKNRKPTVSIIDSHSVRTAEGGFHRGYDAGKKITGRKRHLAVDTLGLVWAVLVHPADWQDFIESVPLLARQYLACRRLKVVFADGAYKCGGLPEWLGTNFGWLLQPVLRPVQLRGFPVLPQWWIIERNFAWISRHRRHACVYERKPENSEALIQLAMVGLMPLRLERSI